jgi:hypothetical protein
MDRSLIAELALVERTVGASSFVERVAEGG